MQVLPETPIRDQITPSGKGMEAQVVPQPRSKRNKGKRKRLSPILFSKRF
jgi:hypothetical protein